MKKFLKPNLGGKIKYLLTFRQKIILIFVFALGLFVSSGFYFYTAVLTNPDRVLDGAIKKSLAVQGFERTITQNSSSGQADLSQETLLSFTPETYSRTLTQLSEQGLSGKSSVATETIGQKEVDYIRYLNIESEGSENKDFSNLLNQWAKRENKPEINQQVSFLNDTLFMVVPFGNLNTAQRSELMKTIEKEKLYDAYTSEKKSKNGRPVVEYKINIEPEALINVLKKYLEITGVGDSTQFDGSQYSGTPAVEIVMEVDVLSRHIKTISYPETERVETYHVYSPVRQIGFPEQTIDVQELQKRLSVLEQ